MPDETQTQPSEARRLAQALPLKIALCPQCAAEFYYPLNDGEGTTCPTMGCNMEMVVYVRSRLPEHYRPPVRRP